MHDPKEEDRKILIDRMLKARGKREIEAAERDAVEWLEENPGDRRVLAARERLDGRRDGERRANKIALAAFAGVFLTFALPIYVLTGWLFVSVLTGAVLGLMVARIVWDGVYENSEESVR